MACDHCVVSEIPDELVELQRRVLRTQRRYVEEIAALHGHSWLRQARDEGRLEQAIQLLREAARAA